MTTEIAQRINQLSEERARLYRLAANGRRADPEVMQRIAQTSLELEGLWELRRKERAGRLDGIDLVIDHVYRRTYGPGYEESVRPTPVVEDDKVPAPVAA